MLLASWAATPRAGGKATSLHSYANEQHHHHLISNVTILDSMTGMDFALCSMCCAMCAFFIVYTVLPACALPHIVLLAHFALCVMCCAKYSGISNRSNFSGDLKTVLTMLTFSSSSWAVRRISLSSVLRHVEDKETWKNSDEKVFPQHTAN